ncbi:MAG: hypothetical protein HGA45_01965 [Chloroflexales bacterium]|nr:hypothetical protein [Chloroflexales bacterium]
MTQRQVSHMQLAPAGATALSGRPAQQIAHRSPELRIQLFGFPQLLLGERPVLLCRRGAVALFAYLVMTRRMHSRDALVALLKDELEEVKARRYLSNVLHDLTGQLGDYLIVSRQTIGFNPALPFSCDVAAFEAALGAAGADGTLRQLQAAVDMFQHELLDGFALGGSGAFEEWLLFERERLSRLLLQALARLCDEYALRGEYGPALSCATRQLALNPWDEAGHRQTMWLLIQSGRRNDALLQYEQCRRRLADDLGIEPEHETTALYEQLRRSAGVSHLAPAYQSSLQPARARAVGGHA